MKEVSKGVSRIALRLSPEQLKALKDSAERSGWGLSEQIRFELFEPRGIWRQGNGPYRPYKVMRSGDSATP